MITQIKHLSFKPYYNWNAFNTEIAKIYLAVKEDSFKPYYNWNAFNTYYRVT